MALFETSEDLLKKALSSPEYISGELEGNWGQVDYNTQPSGPYYMFWVLAKNNRKYFLRFDLASYNQIAPTSRLWNIETDRPLEQADCPSWTKRCQQVFKSWGKDCLYLPCDRLAFEGHHTWPTEHPALVWISGVDSIVKYLNEVFEILN